MTNSIDRVVLTLVAAVALAAAACDPSPEPGDVGIERVEVTQGIQNLLNQVPMIAGKTTYVRVFVRGNTEGGRTVPAVGARLTVDGGAAIAPIGRRSIVPPAAGSDPRTLDDSFLFELPRNVLDVGSHAMNVELVLPAGATVSADANVDAMFDLPFGPDGPSIEHRVYGARYGYRNVPPSLQTRVGLTDSTWPAPAWIAFEPQRLGAQAMLPVAGLSIDHLPTDAITEVDCAYMGDAASGGCSGYVAGVAWAERTIDDAFPTGGQTIVLLQPEAGNGHYGGQYVSPAGNNVINLQADTIDIGHTLAHEIAHSFGLVHTFEDPLYPRPDGALGPYVGVRPTPSLVLVSGDDAAGNVTASDLMSYEFGTWISPYSYCKALARISGGRLLCPNGVDGWDRR